MQSVSDSTLATPQRYIEDVSVGDRIPTLVRGIDEVQLYLFSAATFNSHRIHYDRRWTTEVEGYPDLLVHGPLQSALMAKEVTDWAGPRGFLTSITVRSHASAHPGQELTLTGEVTRIWTQDSRHLVELALSVTHGTRLLISGTATVNLPHRDR